MGERSLRTKEEKGPDGTSEADGKKIPSPDGKVARTALSKSPRKLSTIGEYEPTQNRALAEPSRTSSVSSESSYRNETSSTDSLSSSQKDGTDDCASIVLSCLFCRFYDLILVVRGSCERAAGRICPSYQQFSSAVEPDQNTDWTCSCEFDCGLFDACQETGECLELAMEISEVCYR